jgi:solute carrier family 45, member 1/2/4
MLTSSRPWALACWAPFTFMGIEINKLSNAGNSANPAFRNPSTAPETLEKAHAISSPVSPTTRPGPSGDASSSGELSGVYLGILNLFTTLPQFVGTAISWVVFTLLEPGKSPELAKEAEAHELHETSGPNAIAVCLFIGAISSVGAAYATKGLRSSE